MKNFLRWLAILGMLLGVVFVLILAIMGADNLFGLSMWPWIKETSSGLFHWIRNLFGEIFSGKFVYFLIGAITVYLHYRLKHTITAWLGIPASTLLKAMLVRVFNKKTLRIITIAVGIVGCIIYFYSRPDESDLANQKVKLYRDVLAIYKIPLIQDLPDEQIATLTADDFLTRTFCEFTTVELPKVKAKYLSLVKGDTAAETCSLRPQIHTVTPIVTDLPVSAPLPADADTIKDATVADPTPFIPAASPKTTKPATAATPAKPATAPATRGSSGHRADDGRRIYRSTGNVQTGEFQGANGDNEAFIPIGDPMPELQNESRRIPKDDDEFIPIGDPMP